MRSQALIRLSLVLLLSVSTLIAQERTEERDIFTHLATQSSGGSITISQPDWLRGLVGKASHASATSGSIISGYRIQIYTSNMRGAKQEAYSLANQLKGTVPNLSCYVTYRAPFWRLSVGDYSSRQEAQQQLNALRSAYPRLMREAYIVREKVRVR